MRTKLVVTLTLDVTYGPKVEPSGVAEEVRAAVAKAVESSWIYLPGSQSNRTEHITVTVRQAKVKEEPLP
jgi:hypothetical protein